ncbi:small acid-soluble spore protein Tlp [Paenibacillus sp. IITD108]|uniref:small acid-soluble spore protein Tlp n=1 Tax=Paenibacillus sp. IITD108 TaxID=3116649 RepID=UPI002F3F7C76
MAKPDNRKDNPTHLQSHINHTIANLHEAENYLAEHADEISATEKQIIKAKNERRKDSVESFKAEKQDES